MNIKNELPPQTENPSPFKQPFLVLGITPHKDTSEWLVDVDGKIEMYIEDALSAEGEEQSCTGNATPFMKEMARNLKLRGMYIHYIGLYSGSGGPTHILRNGAFFRRIGFGTEDGIDIPTWMDE